jgi:hypothetical protein
MDEPREAKKSWGARVMAASAVGFLLSLGLCGGTGVVHNSTVQGDMMAVGLLLLLGSLIGMFVGFVMMIVGFFTK